jgi:hypothetical protein
MIHTGTGSAPATSDLLSGTRQHLTCPATRRAMIFRAPGLSGWLEVANDAAHRCPADGGSCAGTACHASRPPAWDLQPRQQHQHDLSEIGPELVERRALAMSARSGRE